MGTSSASAKKGNRTTRGQSHQTPVAAELRTASYPWSRYASAPTSAFTPGMRTQSFPRHKWPEKYPTQRMKRSGRGESSSSKRP
ncbi:hypothetical protein CGRA01v4_02788 [Colletotrichum graminicola]|nr:hypothetical protein CGRA01v4_02788 [Colletotrichum graminicola]